MNKPEAKNAMNGLEKMIEAIRENAETSKGFLVISFSKKDGHFKMLGDGNGVDPAEIITVLEMMKVKIFCADILYKEVNKS